MSDPYGLQRFIDAQQNVYETASAELRAGRKTSHWMWFVFPQLRGLGSSPMSQHYGIASADEARAYLADPLLGPRLVECVAAVNAVKGHTAREIFGQIDEAKFRSSLTLFAQVAPTNPVFAEALRRYFDGERDPITIEKLGPDAGA